MRILSPGIYTTGILGFHWNPPGLCELSMRANPLPLVSRVLSGIQESRKSLLAEACVCNVRKANTTLPFSGTTVCAFSFPPSCSLLFPSQY